MEDLLNSCDAEMFNLGMEMLFLTPSLHSTFPTITNQMLFDWMVEKGHIYQSGKNYVFKKFRHPAQLHINPVVICPLK
jgi:hypothetical protein